MAWGQNLSNFNYVPVLIVYITFLDNYYSNIAIYNNYVSLNVI